MVLGSGVTVAEWLALVVVFGALVFAGASLPVAIVAAVVLSRVVTSSGVPAPSPDGASAIDGQHHSEAPQDCDDPNCVRCNAYASVLELATTRLGAYCSGPVSQRCREGLGMATGKLPMPTLGEEQGGLGLGGDQDGDGGSHGRVLQLVQKMGSPQKTWIQQPSVLFIPYLKAVPFAHAPKWAGGSSAMMDSAAGVAPTPGAAQSRVARIPAELLCGLQDDLRAAEAMQAGWKVNTTAHGEWRVFHLVNQGVRMDAACDGCPAAAKMIAHAAADGGHQALTSVFGNAFFSVLVGDSTISPHCGPTNTRLRVQMVLRADPAGQASLTVAGQTVRLTEGDAVCFDDSFTHAASFTAPTPTATRALFIVDVMSPQLMRDECRLLAHTFAPVHQSTA
jgi:hypothetical protein